MRKVNRGLRRRSEGLVLTGVLVLAGAVGALQAAGATAGAAAPTYWECVDASWAEYHECLNTSRFRLVCDFAFEVAQLECLVGSQLGLYSREVA